MLFAELGFAHHPYDPDSRNCAKPPQARKARHPIAADRTGMPCIRSAEFGGSGARSSLPRDRIGGRSTKQVRANRLNPSIADFCNKICQEQKSPVILP
jgi:hypothetical protein